MLGVLASHAVVGGGTSTLYAAAVLADAVEGYWRQGDASGTTMTDSSGHTHPGVYNSVTLATAGLLVGDTDTAATYNGSSSNADVTYGSWMSAFTSFTAEALIKPTTLGTPRCVMGRDGSGARGWNLYVLSGKLYVDNGAAPNVQGATTLVTGNTYHVAFTYDGTTVRIYLNGVLDGSGAFTLTNNTNTNNLMVGASRAGSPGGPFNLFAGVIDEVAFYPTALSATRIAAHAAAAVGTGIDDTFPGTSLDPAWTRHTVTSGAETWLSPGLQDSSLGSGYGYLRPPPPLGDFSVVVDMTTAAVSAMRGPWILDNSGNGIGACWYAPSNALLVCNISGYAYGGTANQIGVGQNAGQIRLTKIGTSYTCAYSTDGGATWTVESPAMTWAGTPTAVGMGNWLGSTGNATTWNRFRAGTVPNPTPTPATTWDFRGLSALPLGWRRIGVASETFDAAGMSATYSAGQVHAVQLATPVASGLIEAKMISGPVASAMVGPILQASGWQGGQTAWYNVPSGALALSSSQTYTYSSTSANAGGSPAYPVWFRVRIAGGLAYSSFSTNGTTWSSEVSISPGGLAKVNEIALGSIFGGASATKWESVKWYPNSAIAVASGLAMSSGGTTATVNLPSGSAVGDLVVITVGARWSYSSLPAGWTVADANDGSFFNGRTIWKVLNASDVSAGNVAIVTSGAPWTGATAVRITGVSATPTVAVRSTQRWGGGGSALLAAQPSNSFSAAYGSLLLYAGINDSTTAMTISRGAQAGSADNSANIVAHANSEIPIAPLTSVTATFNSAASTSAYYTVLEITP